MSKAPVNYTFNLIKRLWSYYVSIFLSVCLSIWLVVDAGLFYIMNAMLMVLEAADELLAFSDRVMYNYEVAKKVLKILIHNNIN